ncbi:MAG: DNA polymerase IV, partial [Pseudomonadota bacterium]
MSETTSQFKALCRDCFTPIEGEAAACPNCRSVRIARHPELAQLSIAHVDCDAFYAAIEKRDDPSIAAKPVIVGGGKRGVVSTCCYIARTYGVRSAMPTFKALRACPDAVVIKPRMDYYVAEGRKIRTMMQELTPLVQPVSIDEAYLDLTGTEALHECSPAETLMRLQARIEEEMRLTVSVGLSANKFLAKTASELDKPRGFSVISPEEAPDFLAPRSPRFIHGVGPSLAKKLAADGFSTIGALQRSELKELAKRYGEHGL